MKALGIGMGILLLAVQAANAEYRSYTFKGCANDHKAVSQAFIWDMKVGKPKIMQQSASVKPAFPGVVKRYSSTQIRGDKHISALLSGRVPKDGTVTFNPAKVGGGC